MLVPVPVPTDLDVIAEGIRVSKPVVESACRAFESVVGRPLASVGDLLSDGIYAFQCHNRVRLIERFLARTGGRKLTPDCLPAGFLVAALEGAGNVESEELRDVWARLLANAVDTPANQHPMFIDTLRKWSPSEAMLFDRICAECGLVDMPAASEGEWPTTNPAFHELVTNGWGTWQPEYGEHALFPSIAALEATGVLTFCGTSSTGAATVPILRVTPFAKRLSYAIRSRE